MMVTVRCPGCGLAVSVALGMCAACSAGRQRASVQRRRLVSVLAPLALLTLVALGFEARSFLARARAHRAARQPAPSGLAPPSQPAPSASVAEPATSASAMVPAEPVVPTQSGVFVAERALFVDGVKLCDLPPIAAQHDGLGEECAAAARSASSSDGLVAALAAKRAGAPQTRS